MKVSYKWLVSYFKKGDTPKAGEIQGLLNFHAFEVESVEEISGGDRLFDVKVLPNRAHDCLSHYGIARELAAITGKQLAENNFEDVSDVEVSSRPLYVAVEDEALCPRYTARMVEGVLVSPSPSWLKEALDSIGQRAINVAVDLANYAMFSFGQPMHVFDADKISGQTIFVRRAKDGERITTLDGKDVLLDPSILIIADDLGPLAIAGIKGGKRAEVDSGTKNIIMESANFNHTAIRLASQKLGIRTDASVRFEHEVSPVLAELGAKLLTRLLYENCKISKTKIGVLADIYNRKLAPKARRIEVTLSDVNKILGTTMTEVEMRAVLNKLGLEYKNQQVEIPPDSLRLDLNLKQDLVEEVGRLYGYDKINGRPLLPPAKPPEPLKSYFYAEQIRGYLSAAGFSEVYGYSFTESGERELLNPISDEKRFMRTLLSPGASANLAANIRNKDLLGIDEVLLFEVGNVYPKSGERTHCVLGSSDKKLNLKSLLPWENVRNVYKGQENIFEFDLTQLVESLPLPASYDELSPIAGIDVIYRPFSLFPFVSRDIAVFVPVGISPEDVLALIEKNGSPFLVSHKLFDRFIKKSDDGSQKISYAFRLIFQSEEKTLTGEEVNAIMDKITAVLNGKKGWKVR